MRPELQSSLQPLHALQFWQAAAGVGDTEHWLAVLTLDEVGMVVALCPPEKHLYLSDVLVIVQPLLCRVRMCRFSSALNLLAYLSQVDVAQPEPMPGQPSWLQHALSNFVQLRLLAAQEEQKGTLHCMPVVLTASRRASASTLTGTLSSGRSKVKDIRIRPLSDIQMHAAVRNVVTRMHAPNPPADFPANVVLLLRLLGGNPRWLAWSLCALAGRVDVTNEDFPAGTLSSPQQSLGGVVPTELMCDLPFTTLYNAAVAVAVAVGPDPAQSRDLFTLVTCGRM